MLSVKNEALAQIVDAETISELDSLKTAYLGRNGKLTKLIKKIKIDIENLEIGYGSVLVGIGNSFEKIEQNIDQSP